MIETGGLEGGKLKMSLGTLTRILKAIAAKWNVTPEHAVRDMIKQTAARELTGEDKQPVENSQLRR